MDLNERCTLHSVTIDLHRMNLNHRYKDSNYLLTALPTWCVVYCRLNQRDKTFQFRQRRMAIRTTRYNTLLAASHSKARVLLGSYVAY